MKKFGKRLLDAFCRGFEWMIEIPYSFPIFLGLAVALVVFAFGMAIHENNTKEKELADEIAFLKRVCKPIGTSMDRDRNMFVKRTIYQCPDGQLHIR